MSLFGDLDVQSASDDPFGVSAGIHRMVVQKVEVKPTNSGDKTGMYLTFAVADPEDSDNGNTVLEFKEIPDPALVKAEDKAAKRAASFLKMRLASLGIPEDR